MLAYGPKLCVYHAGTGRITFASCLKLTTLFICAFFGFVVTPAYYQKEGLSVTVARSKLLPSCSTPFVAPVPRKVKNDMNLSLIHIYTYRMPVFPHRSCLLA